MFGRHFPPQIGSRVEFDGQTFTFCLGLVEFGNFGDFALDVGEAVVGNVFDVVLDAVLFECEASSGEEDVGLAGCGEIGYAVSDEDNLYERMSISLCGSCDESPIIYAYHGNCAIVTFKLGPCLVLVDG